MTRIRGSIVAALTRSFAPQVVLVDHTPIGPHSELLPMLRDVHSARNRPQLILGLRDIVDDPTIVRDSFRSEKSAEAILRYYDHVLVYGDPAILDLTDSYGLPPELAARLRYVGIVCDRASGHSMTRRAQRDIFVTTGGGEDGSFLHHSILAALRGPLAEAPLSVQMVAGPLMPRSEYRELERAVGREDRIRLVRRSKHGLREGLTTSKLTVMMGGYNSVYEGIDSGARILVVPRTHPRREQLERARRLHALGLLDYLEPEEATDATRLAAKITASLSAPTNRVQPPFGLNGADGAAEIALAAVQRSSHREQAMTRGSSPCA